MTYPKNYIAWDLETSGLDPSTDKILEIGAIKIVDGEAVEEKSWLLNHEIDIPEIITEITGITKETIEKDGIDPKVALDEFLEILCSLDANLTHNGYRFDIPFLLHGISEDQRSTNESKIVNGCVDSAVLYKARALELEQRWNENFIDFAGRVMDIRAYGVKYNVTHCCNELGIEVSNTHRALGDIELTNQIYKKLIK